MNHEIIQQIDSIILDLSNKIDKELDSIFELRRIKEGFK